ncbi:serine/threonine-protein kinase N2 [Xenopus tropicalis]|uniref:Serine/threonine-protein kinase N2 n=1 Tax=Xenopus tropicalis TaxID=8364 RepID=A0A803JGR6_XENTR|nr:serine/threonine-protein kinase N2 [Xenopus tropicalis]
MFRRFFKRIRKIFRRKKVHPTTCIETESSSPDVAAPQEFSVTEHVTQGKDFFVEELKVENLIESPVQVLTDEAIEEPIESLIDELNDEKEDKNSVATLLVDMEKEPHATYIIVKEAVECLDTLQYPDPECPQSASPAEVFMQDEENVVEDFETQDKNDEKEIADSDSEDDRSSLLDCSSESSGDSISSGSSEMEPPMISVTVRPKLPQETEKPPDSPEPLDSSERSLDSSPRYYYLEDSHEYKSQGEDSNGLDVQTERQRPKYYINRIEKSSDSSERAHCLEMALPAIHQSELARTPSKSRTEDYNILSVLGEGSFGQVFLAEHKHSKKKFAIKAIPKNVYDEQATQKIETEKKILQLVKKEKAPFLIGLDTYFVTNYNECLVMEYASGGDLRLLMDKYDLPLKCSIFYAACIVQGLKFLHENNIVHRDLKPENILLDKRGYPRITDYGISKTGIGFEDQIYGRCGTRPYMAPEIFKESHYTRSVDWWALGVIIYEMILRKLPFDGDSGCEIRLKIMFERPNYPPTLPAYVRDILQGLLNKNPALRLGSTVEGAHAVMERPFFFGMKWEALRRKEIKPMFIMNYTE